MPKRLRPFYGKKITLKKFVYIYTYINRLITEYVILYKQFECTQDNDERILI